MLNKLSQNVLWNNSEVKDNRRIAAVQVNNKVNNKINEKYFHF